MRCSFGCREQHISSNSSARSTAYYQTPQGQIKKKEHNDRRKRSDDHAACAQGVEAPVAVKSTTVAAAVDLSIRFVNLNLLAYAEFIVHNLGLSISRKKILEVLEHAITAPITDVMLRQQGLEKGVEMGDTRDERSEPWWPPWK